MDCLQTLGRLVEELEQKQFAGVVLDVEGAAGFAYHLDDEGVGAEQRLRYLLLAEIVLDLLVVLEKVFLDLFCRKACGVCLIVHNSYVLE